MLGFGLTFAKEGDELRGVSSLVPLVGADIIPGVV
jgi:hypothetical protein